MSLRHKTEKMGQYFYYVCVPSIYCDQTVKLTCGKPLLDEREAVSWPSQFNVTA